MARHAYVGILFRDGQLVDMIVEDDFETAQANLGELGARHEADGPLSSAPIYSVSELSTEKVGELEL